MSKIRIIPRYYSDRSATRMLLVLGCLSLVLAACSQDEPTRTQEERVVQKSAGGALFDEAPTADELPQRRLDFTARTELAGIDAPPDTKPAVVELAGTWQLTEIDRSESGSWIHARLRIDRLNMGRDEVPVLGKQRYEERVVSELQRPVMLHSDGVGRIDEIKAPAIMISSALGLIKGLASALQFVRPTTEGAAAWHTTEFDAMGEYAAHYTSPAPREFVRQRGEYTKLSNQGALVPPTHDAPESVSGVSRFEFDEAGLIVSASGEQRVVSAAREVIPAFESKASWTFQVQGASTIKTKPEGTAELEALRSRTLYAPTPDLGAAFELDIAKLGELRSLDEFLDAIGANKKQAEIGMSKRDAETDTDNAVRLRKLQLGLGALLRLDEAAEKLAWTRVAAGHERSDELLLALAGTLRPESHERIAALLSPPAPDAVEVLTDAQKSQLMVATSRGRAPSEHLVNAYAALLDDSALGTTALLGLGSMIFQLLETNPHLAERALEIVVARLSHPVVLGNPERVEYVLRALGNSGHPSVAGLVEPYVGSNAARMRATAVRALRRIESADVDRWLQDLAANDAEPTVRRAAQRVLRERQQRRQGRVR